jgi:hypothetical protein
MTKRKKAILEDKYIQSLPKPLRWIMGNLKYGRREIYLLLAIIFGAAFFIVVSYFMAFNFYYIDGKIEIKPQNAKDVSDAIRGK